MEETVLVTGGAGYIGSHACKALAAAGWRPVAFDNLSQGHRRAVRWGPFEWGDLADADALRKAMRTHRVAAVMHFAASAYVGESMLRPGLYFRNNVANTLRLLEAMVDCGVGRLVLSSSCATYGLPAALPITETHPQEPVNPYGESKLQMERIAAWFGRIHGLRWLALRYFNAAGADLEGDLGEDHDPETHLVPLVIGAALGRRPALTIFGNDYPTPDGTAIRDYIHVADLAAAHVAALDHLQEGDGPVCLNLGTGHGHSVLDIVRTVETVSGRAAPFRFGPRRAGDPPILVADPAAAMRQLAWRPRFSDLSTIVDSALRWHRRQ